MTTINVNGETFVAQGRWTPIIIEQDLDFRCPYCGAQFRPADRLTQTMATLDDGRDRLVVVQNFECQTKFIVFADVDAWYASRSTACKITAPTTDDTI